MIGGWNSALILLLLFCSPVVRVTVQQMDLETLDILDSSRYLPLEELYTFYSTLEKLAPSTLSLKVLGTTFIKGKKQTNDIYLATIGDTNNPILFFDCGIHAREWISPATCAYIIQKLVLLFESDKISPVQSDALKFQWQFIPSLNPDGYQISQKNRMHRKNGRPLSAMKLPTEVKEHCAKVCAINEEDCLGVDLNRNLPSGWGKGHKSFEEESKLYCKQTYKGPEPLSEPETQILHKHVTSIRSQALSAISVHSFAKAIYFPKGWLLNDDPDQIKGEARDLLKKFAKHFNQELDYKIGTVATLLNPSQLSGGATDDYYATYHKFNITYTIELDPGEGDARGFVLPPEEIKPVGRKAWKAFQRIAEKMAEMYKL